MTASLANKVISRREQVLAHAITGALTDKTIARITGSSLGEVRRWRRNAGILLLERRRLAAQRYRDNYRRMLLGLAPVLNRQIVINGWIRRPRTSLYVRTMSPRSRGTRNRLIRVTS